MTKNAAENISKVLIEFNTSKPSELHRSFRELSVLSYWKGTELRSFLLYTGIVVLKHHLNSDFYEHFLKLYCAVTLCYCNYYNRYWNLADEEFKEFIEGFIKLYGANQIVFNIHNLCHVMSDVRRFGSLNEISSYPFESILGTLKAEISKSNKPLEQIARRIVEKSLIEKRRFDTNKNENMAPPMYHPSI